MTGQMNQRMTKYDTLKPKKFKKGQYWSRKQITLEMRNGGYFTRHTQESPISQVLVPDHSLQVAVEPPESPSQQLSLPLLSTQPIVIPVSSPVRSTVKGCSTTMRRPGSYLPALMDQSRADSTTLIQSTGVDR